MNYSGPRRLVYFCQERQKRGRQLTKNRTNIKGQLSFVSFTAHASVNSATTFRGEAVLFLVLWEAGPRVGCRCHMLYTHSLKQTRLHPSTECPHGKRAVFAMPFCSISRPQRLSFTIDVHKPAILPRNGCSVSNWK